MNREVRELKRVAERQGWIVEHTGSGHLRWKPPSADQPLIVTGHTPSDKRAMRNAIAQLRKAGLEI